MLVSDVLSSDRKLAISGQLSSTKAVLQLDCSTGVVDASAAPELSPPSFQVEGTSPWLVAGMTWVKVVV